MSTPAPADPLGAVAKFLIDGIGDLLDTVPPGHGMTGPAVFRPSLPQWVEPNMDAFACIVVRPAGGYKMFGRGQLRVADPTMDLVCYAGAPQQAYSIACSAAAALKQLTMSVWGNTKLFWANIAGGPIPLPDQQTLWPACWLGAQVMHSEIAEPG